MIPYAWVGRAVDYDAMIDRAAALGRDGTRFTEALAGLRQTFRPVAMPTLIGFDQGRLADDLAAFADRGYRQPVDAGVLVSKSGFSMSKFVDGVRVDTSRVASALAAALLDPATPASMTMTADAIRLAPATSNSDAGRALRAAQRIATDLVLVKGTTKWKIKASRIRSWITFAGQGSDYSPVVATAAVPGALKGVAKDVKRKPTEASFVRTRSGQVFGVTASRLGRALDVDATSAAVVAALAVRAEGRDKDSPVKVKTMQVAPTLTTGEATKKASTSPFDPVIRVYAARPPARPPGLPRGLRPATMRAPVREWRDRERTRNRASSRERGPVVPSWRCPSSACAANGRPG